jgi:serine protease inhibitor
LLPLIVNRIYNNMKSIIPFLMTAMLALACEKENDKTAPKEPVVIEITEKTASVIKSDNIFGFDIFREILKNDDSENVFISPTSIALALAMTYNGAKGETKAAFETALRKQGYSVDEINESYKSLIGALKSVDPKVLLEIANSIWYRDDETFNVLDDFININEEFYDAEVNALDFNDPDAIDVINGWVNNKTHGLIEKIFDSMHPDAVMYLVNAIYFKGIWKHEFEESKTVNEIFYNSAGTEISTDYMKQSISLKTLVTDRFTMAELPYGQGNFSMTVLLPHEGFTTDDVADSLTQENWDFWISQLYMREVDLSLPKFKFEYKKQLNDVLTSLGLGIAFTDFADFSGINGTGGLQISKVMHKSFIEVNEEGTEAAAVTGVEIIVESLPETPLQFHVNHPFVFALRETTTGAVLFLGKVQDPTAEKNGE